MPDPLSRLKNAMRAVREAAAEMAAPDALRALFRAQDTLYDCIQKAALAYGNGQHPKHTLIRYDDFFCSRIPAGARVLDVGCSNGTLALAIAQRCKARITAVEVDGAMLETARTRSAHPGITYVQADIRSYTPPPCDAIVLSNVLEHLDDRAVLVRRLLADTGARQVLIRVPMFERSWTIAMRRELGVPYFLDKTHTIEYTRKEWLDEIQAMRLTVVHEQINWGEIWADLVPYK